MFNGYWERLSSREEFPHRLSINSCSCLEMWTREAKWSMLYIDVIYTYVNIYTHICVCINIWVFVNVWLCVCVCVYVHTQLDICNNNNYRKDHNFGRSNPGRVSKEMKGLINGDEVLLCEVLREKSCLKIIP